MSMRLETVRKVVENEVNDISICKNVSNPTQELHTVIDVKDHATIRTLLGIYEKEDERCKDSDMLYFSAEGKNRVVYPYVKERPLKDFYMSDALSLPECEEIGKNLVLTCMTSELPYPLLFLALKQAQVHLAADRNVYLSYMLDLTDLDAYKEEKDCVRLCAEIVRDILSEKEKSKADSYVLLFKKTQRNSYLRFTELYRDLDVAGAKERKRNLIAAFWYWFGDNRDRLFRILFVVVAILAIFTLITLITNAIFGDVPWLRFFIRSFETIGLESLLQ